MIFLAATKQPAMARATWPVHTCRVASHGYFAPKSVVVNQAFVRHFFEKEDPIGKRFTAKFSPGPEDPPNWTIVGVINDTKQRGLAAEVTPEVTPLLPSGLDS